MGAFDQIANIQVPDDTDPIASAAFRRKWGWEPHELVIMRGSFSAGDQEAIGNASMSADKKGNVTFNAGSGRLTLLARMIVDWTFSAGGHKVPVTMDAIKRLPASYTNPLLEKCDEIAQGMTEEEQADFFDAANGHFAASSGEMSSFLLK